VDGKTVAVELVNKGNLTDSDVEDRWLNWGAISVRPDFDGFLPYLAVTIPLDGALEGLSDVVIFNVGADFTF